MSSLTVLLPHSSSEIMNRSIFAASEYFQSIMEYKTTSVFWQPLRKLSSARRVRNGKRCLREQTSDFESHYAVRHSSP